MVKSRRSGRKKKKYFRAVLAILILTVLSGGIVGCTFETQYSKNLKRIFETEYFRCINYEGEDTVKILCLTQLGEEQEVLIIPETINGFVVDELGGEIRGRGPLFYGGLTKLYQFDFSLNTKKVYILSKIKAARMVTTDHNMIIVTMCEQDILTKHLKRGSQVLVSNKKTENYHCLKPNVEFIVLEGEEETTYWIDYVSDEKREYALPTVPIREGYEFVCWCTDIDCETVWDGIYDFSGKEQKFYAKWTQA